MCADVPDYQTALRAFRWRVPARYNIGEDACDRWAAREPGRLALIQQHGSGRVERITYGELKQRSDRFANALKGAGIERGDRVALLLPQAIETAVAHLAIYKLGAIALPLASLFGVEALNHRLGNSRARAVVTDGPGLDKVRRIAGALPALETLFCIDGPDQGALGFHESLNSASPDFTMADTGADDPALMVYTSGTTGPPKGALHAHRVLLGHIPGIGMPHEGFPRPGDLMWTPADWAWAGGLLNILLSGLRAGVPVLGHAFGKFDPETAFALMERFGVRNTFIPPTALKIMRTVERPGQRFRLSLRSIGSGGEALGREVYDWAESELGLPINEFYGQTECNLVLASAAGMGVYKAGAIGKQVPGHVVAIVDGEGRRLKPGETGQIAVRAPDPVMFLEYWDNPQATRDKFIKDWMTTGDQGVMDEEGYFSFVGRDDDVITSAGFRIGPGEIEDCLIGHPAVALAAAVGKPDPMRTERIKAYIVLNQGHEPSEALAGAIQEHVRTRLSAHEYPREIAFVGELPLTTTGKVIRSILRDQARREAEAEQGE